MTAPNPEQRVAIEHCGGVLLQAGAGSGKTFVLVEHIVHLIAQFIADNHHLPAPRFATASKKYFNSIAVMTFTRKAAGELSLRVQRRMRQALATATTHSPHWKVALANLGQLFVGTIHSFCLRLIDEGHFTELPPNRQTSFREKLTLLLDDALGNFLLQNSSSDPIFKTIATNYKPLLDAMTTIFLDPSLRLNWQNLQAPGMIEQNFSHTLKSIFDLQGLSPLFSLSPPSFSPQDQDKNWARYLAQAAQVLSWPQNAQDLMAHQQFFATYRRLPSKPRNRHDLAPTFQQLKQYRDFLTRYSDAFAAYEQNRLDTVLQWCQWQKKIFTHLDHHYTTSGAMTFSDFEYLVLKGLQNNSVRKKISHRYQYLIVDEFQDTSQAQFTILRQLIGDNFHQLFVVGDVKQAIYGFRGGEISVFQACQSHIPRNLELRNNYRSAPRIVDFNNRFFANLFAPAPGFRGGEKLLLPASTQRTPNPEQVPPGAIEVWMPETASALQNLPEKLTPHHINALEAQAIASLLKHPYRPESGKTTGILYKKLAPSLLLIRQLLDQGASFTAQIKIPYGEAPLLALFYRLIAGYLAQQDTHTTCFLVQAILRYLHLDTALESQKIQAFYRSLETIGPYPAYANFLFEQGISNSLHEASLAFIHPLLEACRNDLERFYLYFTKIKEDSFSFEFQTGSQPETTHIMTVHAAKGLEFNRVILGGVHTNGQRNSPRSPLFGHWPGSFRWKANEAQKKFHPTPSMILEEQEENYKNAAEDNRLFYVAATRAKESLSWIDFDLPKGAFSCPRASWIHHLRDALSSPGQELITVRQLIPDPKHREPSAPQLSSLARRPFFHHHGLGPWPAEKTGEGILLLNELSVTKVVTLCECPRKFYLKHILNISSNDFTLSPGHQQPSLVPQPEPIPRGDAKGRGSQIHQAIAQMIQAWPSSCHSHEPSGVPQSLKKDQGSEQALQWAKKQLLPYQGCCQLFSEQPLVFSLFGLMVSGIPDLVILAPPPQSPMIWDFKTGAKKQDPEPYWTQLKLYALALWELGYIPSHQAIELSVLYLDQEEKLTCLAEFRQTKEQLFRLWKSANSIHNINRTHCPRCPYHQEICRPPSP